MFGDLLDLDRNTRVGVPLPVPLACPFCDGLQIVGHRRLLGGLAEAAERNGPIYHAHR
jgi:hypothetical protein